MNWTIDSHNETILVRDLNEYSKIVELYHFKIEEKKEGKDFKV